MSKIYFINSQGIKVSVEVSKEIAKQYRESLRKECCIGNFWFNADAINCSIYRI